jgi:hypothetical protein
MPFSVKSKSVFYPGNFGEDSSWRGDLRRDYSLLREFYKRAAQSGDGVVTWIA